MNKTDFEKIFQKGFNKEKIYFEDAQKGESELFCFKCGAQAGLGYVYSRGRRKTRVKCVKRKSHAETLIKYTAQFVEMEHDLLNCKLNGGCNTEIKTDY